LGAGSLRVICGPTAAGKSTLALQVASHRNASIISADSRQIYRGFDIGTAKPSVVELASVDHYGIDVAEPTERFSASRWSDAARRWIAEIEQSGKTPLVVGGTGLYIRALIEPLFRSPELDTPRRVALEAVLASQSIAELRRWCAELDPARSALGRTQLLRAIETALLTGQRISGLHTADKANPRDCLKARYLLVDPGAELAVRIEKRVDGMLERGWADEVQSLMRTVPSDAPAWKASGYGAIREHVSGALSLSSARERVIIETRQYAKRQRTWFRHQLPAATVTRVNPDDPASGAVVREWWESTE
jgi:tRNA dimethylallyltransferase